MGGEKAAAPLIPPSAGSGDPSAASTRVNGEASEPLESL